MPEAPDSLADVETLIEEGWDVRWDGRTGSEYPPAYRIVELEKQVDPEPYTRVRQFQVDEDDFETIEERYEESQ